MKSLKRQKLFEDPVLWTAHDYSRNDLVTRTVLNIEWVVFQTEIISQRLFTTMTPLAADHLS
jgi:hypothetical protein